MVLFFANYVEEFLGRGDESLGIVGLHGTSPSRVNNQCLELFLVVISTTHLLSYREYMAYQYTFPWQNDSEQSTHATIPKQNGIQVCKGVCDLLVAGIKVHQPSN